MGGISSYDITGDRFGSLPVSKGVRLALPQ
uniref:Uncharacterized protein n=1 Tax=Anguilla anguilla TaxID=7936 RepID=A0A0E9VWU6_ANGAN